MASLAGFEPTTRCLEGSRSVQLSYRDVLTPFKCSTIRKRRSRAARWFHFLDNGFQALLV